MSGAADTIAAASLRLDKWLWFARLVRTRSVATRLCAAGCVAVGVHQGAKPHHPVRVGDVVTVDLAHHRRCLIVRVLGRRRGPASEARGLYHEPAPPIGLGDSSPAWTSLFAEEDKILDDHQAA